MRINYLYPVAFRKCCRFFPFLFHKGNNFCFSAYHAYTEKGSVLKGAILLKMRAKFFLLKSPFQKGVCVGGGGGVGGKGKKFHCSVYLLK